MFSAGESEALGGVPMSWLPGFRISQIREHPPSSADLAAQRPAGSAINRIHGPKRHGRQRSNGGGDPMQGGDGAGSRGGNNVNKGNGLAAPPSLSPLPSPRQPVPTISISGRPHRSIAGRTWTRRLAASDGELSIIGRPPASRTRHRLNVHVKAGIKKTTSLSPSLSRKSNAVLPPIQKAASLGIGMPIGPDPQTLRLTTRYSFAVRGTGAADAAGNGRGLPTVSAGSSNSTMGGIRTDPRDADTDGGREASPSVDGEGAAFTPGTAAEASQCGQGLRRAAPMPDCAEDLEDEEAAFKESQDIGNELRRAAQAHRRSFSQATN